MKRILLTVAALLLLASSVLAQDSIYIYQLDNLATPSQDDYIVAEKSDTHTTGKMTIDTLFGLLTAIDLPDLGAIYVPIGHLTTYNHDHYDTAYGWGNHASAGYLTVESDPAVATHESTYNHSNYNTAYGWGNHASAGYLTAESDPAVTIHESTYNHSNYDTAYGWGNHASAGYLTTETDPGVSTHESTYNHSNYDTAYSWGNHASAGYLTAESDPGVTTHESSYNHSNYDTAYGWGDHSTAGYLTVETDPAVGTHESTYNHSNYDTAYSWGDHSAAGYLTVEADPGVGTHESTYNHSHYDTAYGWGDHSSAGYLTVEADPAVGTHESTYNHGNYDTAYGWGDHAQAGYVGTITAGNDTIAVSCVGGGVDSCELSVPATAISGRNEVAPVTGDYLLLWDATDSGLKKIDIKHLGNVSTGVISGGLTLTADQARGVMYYVTAACTVGLPAIAEYLNVCFQVEGAVAVSIDANASDKIKLNGTWLDDGDKITSDGTTNRSVCLVYRSADGWATWGITDGWSDGGP